MKRALILLLVVCGCSSENVETIGFSGDKSVRVLKHDGHDYIIFEGGGVVHSESCPCKTK